MKIGRFYLRRTLRIWPLYFFILAFGFLVTAPGGITAYAWEGAEANWRWGLHRMWMYVTFTSNWSLVLNGIGGYVDHAPANLQILWSIAVEEPFYLLFPVLLLLCFRKPGLWSRLAVGAMVLGLGSRLALVWSGESFPVPKPGGYVYYSTFSYVEVFAAGALAAVLITDTGAAGKIRGLLRRRGWGLALLGLMAALGWLWSYHLFPPYGSSSRGLSKFRDYAIATTIYPVIAILIGVVLLWVTLNPQSLFPRFLRTRWMRALGTLSFGIYVWHPLVQPVIRALDAGSVATMPAQTRLLGANILFLLYLSLIVACAGISYFLVEGPVLLWKERLSVNPAAAKERERNNGRSPTSVFPAAVAIAMFSAILVFSRALHPATAPATALRLSVTLPEIVSAKRIEPPLIELRWTGMAAADEYQIEMAGGMDDFRSIGKTPSTRTSYQVGDADGDSAYRFRIRGCVRDGPCSPYSQEVVSDAYQAVASTVPQGLRAERRRLGMVRLSWAPLTGLKSYRVEMARGFGPFKQIGDSGTAHYDIANLPPREFLRFRIRACSFGGSCSPYSPVAVTQPITK